MGCRTMAYRSKAKSKSSLSAPRRRGRPKEMWASEAYTLAVKINEGSGTLGGLVHDAAKWRSKIPFHFPWFSIKLTALLAFPANVSPYTGRTNEKNVSPPVFRRTVVRHFPGQKRKRKRMRPKLHWRPHSSCYDVFCVSAPVCHKSLQRLTTTSLILNFGRATSV